MVIARTAMLFLLTAASALTVPINWTLDATLSDGATVTGYFVFDPDLGLNQIITNFSVSIGTAAPGILLEPFDHHLPARIFFPFHFTPANSSAAGPFVRSDGAFEFASNASFANPIKGLPPETLSVQFVPVAPLSDTSRSTINNSNIKVNDPHSGECFNCTPYVCFSGATSYLCTGNALTQTPEPGAVPLVVFGICVFSCALLAGRRQTGWGGEVVR
jgi:hypothetical protein